MQAEATTEIVVDQQRHALDCAIQSQLPAARPQFGKTERIGGAAGRRDAAALERGAGGRVFLVIENQRRFGCIAQQRTQAGADGERVLAVQFATGALGVRTQTDRRTGDIVDEPIARPINGGDAAKKKTVDERGIERGFDSTLGKITDTQADAAAELILRLGADDADRTNAGSRTEQGGLRALEDFDPFDVEQLENRTARPADINAVKEHGHPGREIGRARVAGNAADHEAGVVRALLLNLDAGHETGQFKKLLDADTLKEAAVIGSHADWHILCALFAALRGDCQAIHDQAGLSGSFGFFGLPESRGAQGGNDGGKEELPGY